MGSGCVSENMRGHTFRDPRILPVSGKETPDVRAFQSVSTILAYKHSLMFIGSSLQIFPYPDQSPVGKEHSSFFISFANDAGFFALEINLVPVKGQYFADPHTRAHQYFNQSTEPYSHIHGFTISTCQGNNIQEPF